MFSFRILVLPGAIWKDSLVIYDGDTKVIYTLLHDTNVSEGNQNGETPIRLEFKWHGAVVFPILQVSFEITH